MRRAGLVVAAAVLVAFAVAPAFADSDTKKLRGTVVEQAVTGPACASPVGLCATGVLRGGIHSPFDLVVTAITPTSSPDVVILDTSVVVHTRSGDLTTAGHTVYNTVTGYFSSVDSFTGGTGRWAGASGSLQSTGQFLPESGGTGEYQAVLSTG